MEATVCYQPDPKTLLFLLGELPSSPSLYERARANWMKTKTCRLTASRNWLLSARTNYLAEMKRRARKITPHLLRQCLKYIRNLSLLESALRRTYTRWLVAAKQVCGDQLLCTGGDGREYEYHALAPYETIKLASTAPAY